MLFLRWQPQFRVLPGKIGEYYIQHFLTPELAFATPITYPSAAAFTYPDHGRIKGVFPSYFMGCDRARVCRNGRVNGEANSVLLPSIRVKRQNFLQKQVTKCMIRRHG